MAEQAKTEAVSITRRLLVASMLAAPIVATAASGQAATTPDPVFAAIEHHKETRKAFLLAVDDEDVLSAKTGQMGPEWAAQRLRYKATSEANDEAICAMCETVPTTFAGLAALSRYAAEIHNDELEGWDEPPAVKLFETICKAAKRLQKGGCAS